MGKRRKKGTGSISERPDGRFDVAITLDTLLGKRRFKTTTSTYRDGERWIARTRNEYEQTGLSPEAGGMTVSKWFPLWLDSIEGTVSPSTHRDYGSRFRVHIEPSHGKVRLKDLTAAHLTALYRDMAHKGASPGLVRYTHAV